MSDEARALYSRATAAAKIATLEAELVATKYQRDNAARNERLRIAERAEALAAEYKTKGLNHGWWRSTALEALAAELRADGGGE